MMPVAQAGGNAAAVELRIAGVRGLAEAPLEGPAALLGRAPRVFPPDAHPVVCPEQDEIDADYGAEYEEDDGEPESCASTRSDKHTL